MFYEYYDLMEYRKYKELRKRINRMYVKADEIGEEIELISDGEALKIVMEEDFPNVEHWKLISGGGCNRCDFN